MDSCGATRNAPTGRHRVLQIHPTRRCNLRCLHCYSQSGPEVSQELDAGVAIAAIQSAAALGYDVAGFSGGEPLLYGPLGELLDAAHATGMTTTVTTNGMPLSERRIAMLRGRADLLAISLDGIPESHNRLRVCDHAFETMQSRLVAVRDSGIPFGFIFTLTFHNVHELDWAADFAAAQGAVLLQIHPLENVGRAAEALDGSEPDGLEGAYALWEALRIEEKFKGQLYVQLDMATGAALRCNRDGVFAGPPPDAEARFADVLSPLVIETDGTLCPLVYGFPRRFALGNILDASVAELAERWLRETMPAFRAICRQVYRRLLRRRNLTLVNWYEEIRTVCERDDGSRTSVAGYARAAASCA